MIFGINTTRDISKSVLWLSNQKLIQIFIWIIIIIIKIIIITIIVNIDINNNNFFFTEYCYENEPKPDAIRQADCYSKVDPCPPGLKDCSDEFVCPLSTNKCCCP